MLKMNQNTILKIKYFKIYYKMKNDIYIYHYLGLGDATKAKEKLGWEAKTKFKDLIEKMMKNELK